MSYAKYKRMKDAEFKFLIDFGIKELPVKISAICNRLNIKLQTMEQAKPMLCRHFLWVEAQKLSALYIYTGMQSYIVYNQASVQSGQARFTVAHELSHILLGHTTEKLPGCTVFRTRVNIGDWNMATQDTEERAADQFALRVLAPLCVLDAIDADTPDKIAYVCGIPATAARVRADQLALARRSGKMLERHMERRVLAQFDDYICSYQI